MKTAGLRLPFPYTLVSADRDLAGRWIREPFLPKLGLVSPMAPTGWRRFTWCM